MSFVILADIQQQYIGCYRQNGGLSAGAYNHPGWRMTVEWCQVKCQQLSYTYFGLQVSLFY